MRVNEKRIAKNTVFLYFRMLLTIAISLYTSRVILEALGVKDYGIYNIVGGLILILSFLNGTMSGATQRFLNFEMGRGEEGRLRETFAASWVIHLTISVILLVLGETFGLWFVNNCLVIAPERMVAANWVYQCSLFGGIAAVLMVPFTGSVFAHEKMNAYAFISLLFTVLKLLIALAILFYATFDNLIIYAAMMLGANIIHFLCFFIYSTKNFDECRLTLTAPKDSIKSMLSYSASDLIGTSCYTVENQGVLVILNHFGGTALNAVGGLTSTVTLNLNQFGSSLIMAFRPQIIQQYAAKKIDVMQRLLTNCSKYAILLLAIFAVPAFIEMDFILSLWLKEVPPLTSQFCRIALIASVPQMAVTSLACGIHATGKVFRYSAVTGFTYIILLPLMYILLKLTGIPVLVYVLPIIQLTINVIVIALMLHRLVNQFRVMPYVVNGFIAPAVITIATCVATYFVAAQLIDGWMRLIATGAMSTLLLCTLSWFILFDREMRKELVQIIKDKLHIA